MGSESCAARREANQNPPIASKEMESAAVGNSFVLLSVAVWSRAADLQNAAPVLDRNPSIESRSMFCEKKEPRPVAVQSLQRHH